MTKKVKAKKKGMVYLVGAGPWEPGLLTLRGAALLSTAEAVVYDRLVNPQILLFASRAGKFYVGKRTGPSKTLHHWEQKQINALLLSLIKEGKTVVRLKGGDPFIFGRGGEEASFLRKKKISFEIVPGISAGIAAPAYAGIPLTDRRYASSVTFVTAHEDIDKKSQQVDWEEIARLKGTVVIFMGVGNLSKIIKAYQKSGKSRATRISVIEWATDTRQKVVTGRLGSIVQKVRRRRIQAPSVIVIGEVNRFRKQLAWFRGKHRIDVGPQGGSRPLSGKTVLITRALSQASVLKQSLASKGATVVEFPVIQIDPPLNWRPLDQALQTLSRFDWLVLTSVNAVLSVMRRIKQKGGDSRRLAPVKIAAIGKATAGALDYFGIRADLIPRNFTSRALLQNLTRKGQIRNKRFLLPRTDIAPEYLRQALIQKGARVTQVTAYRTHSKIRTQDKEKVRDLMRKKKIDYVTFTSSSTVRGFFKAFPGLKKKKNASKFISIGPVTTRTLKEYGVRPYREARTHTIPGLVEVMANGE